MSCAVLPNSARLEKRNDAARGSNGAGKPQGPWGGRVGQPHGLSLPPHSLEPRSLIYRRIPWLSLTPLRAFFALKRRPMPWPIGTVPFGHLVPKSALVECASCTM